MKRVAAKKREQHMWVRSNHLQYDAASAKSIFRFEVCLLSGPVAPSFVSRHPEAPSRTIDIRGSQTLDTLHQAIFDAFDREDPHMYEFQIGGKKPMDRKSVRYSIVLDGDAPEEKSAKATAIAALHLKVGGIFFYWFDFGDDWWHEIRLLAVNPPAKDRGRYPRLVERHGESPPQYIDWEAEEDDSVPDANVNRSIPLAENAGSVPEEQRLGAISALIKEFCESHLTKGYVEVCDRLLASASGARLPLQRGKPQGWAAALVHAAGMINFLHDPASEPHMKLRDIAQPFGVSPATMENKSRDIRNAVNAFPLDPRFCLSENLAKNPLVWLHQLDGILVDLRRQPREVQEAAYKAGLIPFIPEPSAVPALPELKKNVSKKESRKKFDQYDLLE
jgi:hypothetical protein